jgi:hypothetical protein
VLQGYMGFASLKKLRPLWVSSMRKRVRAISKCTNGNLVMKAHL